MSSDKDECWFAVRCVFASGWPPDRPTPVYEERITLWLAASAEEAIERAEVEALQYAGTIEEHPTLTSALRSPTGSSTSRLTVLKCSR